MRLPALIIHGCAEGRAEPQLPTPSVAWGLDGRAVDEKTEAPNLPPLPTGLHHPISQRETEAQGPEQGLTSCLDHTSLSGSSPCSAS